MVHTQEFERVFESHHREIIRFVAMRVKDRVTAEDISGTAFLRYWESLNKGTIIENVRAFLYHVARGLIIDEYRKNKHRETQEYDDAIDELFTTEINVQESDDARDYNRILSRLGVLKSEYQEVILLHYVEGLTMAEVAEILDESENNIRVRVHRALTKLREQFTI